MPIVEPYWEEVDNPGSFEIQWKNPAEGENSGWYPYGIIHDSTEEQAVKFFRQIREERKKKSGAQFRLVKTVQKIYHEGF